MPLTSTGAKVKKAMEKLYGKDKGESVFYAKQNKLKNQGKNPKWEAKK